METNEVINKLPPHLMQFVIDQPYTNYTFLEQAVWRYVMRQNYNYLSKVAHEAYVDGLLKTGISIDNIASMYGMNRILKEIGWAAVAVDGFIPPAAFMEFQAYNVLVIAADIRTIEHIEYTPAPDILHEAAGHAPIIADAEYAAYLRFFGEVGCKAFSSKKDYDLYEAIRHLSIIKEDPNTAQQEIIEGENAIASIQKNMGEPSEMALLRNLHWWTVEYGLIGTLQEYKIYGAGLLSSIGESYNCFKPTVKKLPYTIDAAHYNFDITSEQPHLFVTPHFKHLTTVLNEFLNTMAIRVGGLESLQKAIDSENTGTAVYSSGLQVSGTFSNVIKKDKQAIYLQTTGATSLAYNNKELNGHNKTYHKDGFGSPIGNLYGGIALENLSNEELKEQNIIPNTIVFIEFESGIKVSGILTGIVRGENNKILLLSFNNCTVNFVEKILFNPSWGVYDMAVGASIVSVFSGAADVEAFQPSIIIPKEKTHKIKYNAAAIALHQLYGQVRVIRESKTNYQLLAPIFEKIQTTYPTDWLLPLEILEIINQSKDYSELSTTIKNYLEAIKTKQTALSTLIDNGINLIANAIQLS